MAPNMTLLLMIVTVTSVTSQTFQYSRGWTNGKRDGHKGDEVRDVAASLERILSPCQLNKLKYVLEGRPLNERLFRPCEFEEDEPKRFKSDRNQDPPFETFQ